MSEDKLVPCIRFKGFVGEWENRSFKDIVTINSGKDYKHLSKGDIPVYGTGGLMLYVNDKLSEKDAIGIGRKGTIDRPQFLKAPFWTVDTLFFMVPKKKFNIYFVYCLSEKTNWKKYDESTGLPSLSKSTISKISSFTPPLKEQQKIGGLFAKLDRLLDLQQQKLDQLELLKKALLQKLFPKQDAKIPELRFKGFVEEWGDFVLGKIAKFLNGRAYKQSELLEKGKYPVLRVGNFYTNDSWYYSNLQLPEKYYAKKGDLLYTWSATFGPHIWNGSTVIYHYHIWKIELSSLLNKEFTYQLLLEDRSKLLNNTNGSTMIHLTKSEMESKLVKIPNIAEQQKIGNLLAKVDRLIELENKKFSNLKLVKKILLQNMFVE